MPPAMQLLGTALARSGLSAFDAAARDVAGLHSTASWPWAVMPRFAMMGRCHRLRYFCQRLSAREKL